MKELGIISAVRKRLLIRSSLKPYQKLQRHWARGKIPLAMASERNVGALEAKYGIRLPGDFRDYLLNSCPQETNWMYETLCIWWALSDIKNIPDEISYELKNVAVAAHANSYLFFVDYNIWCWAWAIDCGDDENRGRIAVIDGLHDAFVADTFREFVDRYLVNENDLAPR